MKLILESWFKNPEGVFDVGVIILNEKSTKRYTFVITSEFILKRIQLLCSKNEEKCYGKAINLLKSNNIFKKGE